MQAGDVMDKNTEKIKRRYNRIAKVFDLTEVMMERGQMKLWRAALWKEAKGKILEVGVGTGKNIRYYPQDADITAIDFSERMLEKARVKAEKAGKNVDLKLMDVQQLDFPEDTFDTVITTCVFCSVPDPIKGLQEIRRVCKKDGQIIMLEHVRSKRPMIGVIMDILNPLVVRIVGANINRDTIENLKHAGLKIEVEKDLMADIVKHIQCTNA
jgi:ubiquinone/menaquinone biosynthesis C-methylase UbiE